MPVAESKDAAGRMKYNLCGFELCLQAFCTLLHINEKRVPRVIPKYTLCQFNSVTCNGGVMYSVTPWPCRCIAY